MSATHKPPERRSGAMHPYLERERGLHRPSPAVVEGDTLGRWKLRHERVLQHRMFGQFRLAVPKAHGESRQVGGTEGRGGRSLPESIRSIGRSGVDPPILSVLIACVYPHWHGLSRANKA